MVTKSAQFAGQRVLVTGAKGFVGLHLCRKLAQVGAELFAVSRNPREAGPEALRWYYGEMSDASFVRSVLSEARPQFVFHLSGHVTGLRESEVVTSTFHSNLTSTVNLLIAATEMKSFRTVLPGSLEEPDEIDGTPSSPYAAAKWASAGYARMFERLYGTSVATARLFMVYGPEQLVYHKLVPYVITSLLKGEAPQLSSGRRIVDWIYVDDAVEGLMALAVSNGPLGQRVDLGSGRTVSIRETVERIARIVGGKARPHFGALQERPDERIRVADIAATERAIGWKPKISLDEGLARTVAWYRQEIGKGEQQAN